MHLLLLALLTTNPANHHSVVQQPKHSEAVNDAFVSALLERASYVRLIAAHYPITAKALQVGSGRMVSFSHGVNKFTCFKGPNNTFPISFTITSPEPLLAPILTLSSTKSAVLKRLGISHSLDILQVSNLEAMALVILYFHNEKLVKVTYGATID